MEAGKAGRMHVHVQPRSEFICHSCSLSRDCQEMSHSASRTFVECSEQPGKSYNHPVVTPSRPAVGPTWKGPPCTHRLSCCSLSSRLSVHSWFANSVARDSPCITGFPFDSPGWPCSAFWWSRLASCGRTAPTRKVPVRNLAWIATFPPLHRYLRQRVTTHQPVRRSRAAIRLRPARKGPALHAPALHALPLPRAARPS